jgi:hypothetical protein
MKPLIELSIEQYESLLKWASENSPLYFRLKNAVKTQAKQYCRSVWSRRAGNASPAGKHFLRRSTPNEKAIRLARFP